jgi:hypothetical protein
LSDASDAVLERASAQTASLSDFTQTPYVTVNGAPSFTDTESLNFTLNQALGRANTALEATAEATVEATDEVLVITVEPLLGEHVEPPLQIDLPAGWGAGYDMFVLGDLDAIRNIPIAVYSGPVTGGRGSIVLIWGFPNVLVGNPFAEGGAHPDLYLDGTRLLRMMVFEQGCNIGTDVRRDYSVGGMAALGTQFAAVTCPSLPDARGWFAGLQQFNLNFVFYVYVEPKEALEGAEAELQTILNSVRFVAPPTPEATEQGSN